ncbi:MAG: cyanophycin synthetase [Flavobacteriales bacterium]
MKPINQSVERALENKLVEARKETMRRLGDIEHRLEFVDEVNGVEFVNDAKATDINSTWYSIDCMDRPIVWIVSSSQYEDDYALFGEIDAKKVRALIIMGTAKEEVKKAFENRIELIGHVNTMNEAVAHAILISNEGDVVLFSPACSDYDNFKHYKEAGQQFRKAVRETRL